MRIHFWNLMFSLFFLVLVLLGAVVLLQSGRMPQTITFGNVFLLSLAIFRLVRLFTYDHITEFIRDWFVGAPKNSFRGTMGALLNCPWCTGLWFSFIVVFFAFMTALAWPVILILALAALASFFQLFTNLVGWHAEAKKEESKAGRETPGKCQV